MRIGLLAEACPARLDRRSPPREIRRLMRPDLSESSIVEPALAYAERKGFRLAVIGRICALVAIAAFYLTALRYPNTIYVPALLLAIAAVGLAPLGLVGSRYERVGRYARSVRCLFWRHRAAPATLLKIWSSSPAGPTITTCSSQLLALSPLLVLWTGLCAVSGLSGATTWIMAGMERQSASEISRCHIRAKNSSRSCSIPTSSTFPCA